MHPLRRLFEHARPYRRKAIVASVFSALNKLFDVLPELLIGVAVDVVVNRKDSFLADLGIIDPWQQLLALAAATVAIWVLESTFEYLYAVNWRSLAQDLQHELRIDTYAHIQRLDPGTLAEARTGRLMAVLNEDVHQIERFLNSGANDIIQVFLSSILVGAVFLVLTPTLAGLSLLPVPLILVGAFWFQRKLAPRYGAAREAASQLSGRLENNLLGMSTIQAYTAERFEAEHLREASDAYRARNGEAIRVSAAITPVIRMGVLAGFVATLLYGGNLALVGALGVGSYSALVYLTQRLLWPLTRLADMTDQYQRSMTSVSRVMDLLELPVRTTPVTAELPRPPQGEVLFRELSFAYGDHQVLDNVTLEVPAGRTVALVGATGSGKSTLLKLLLRFLAPDRGGITFDGVPIDTVALAELRGAIGYVAQEPFLTDGTVADNIAYGDTERGPEQQARIEAAARQAEAHGFIAALPLGYDTPVGERGARLSGGQRQRVALARALYRNPALLVLDEATSAVDNETEAAIQRSLERAARERTLLVVAHRLSTVRFADRIYVLVAGRVEELGSHEELLARGGTYAALWRLQTGERVDRAAK
jgi:ATP-binding cassette subfamily B protein